MPLEQLESAHQEPGQVSPREVRARRKLGLLAWFAVGWLVLVTALALAAPILPLKDPIRPTGESDQPVGSEGHLLGTDQSRRDVLSRCIWGARTSLAVGLGAVGLGLAIGGALGLISGFRRGRIDSILSSLFDVILAFPQLILALSLVAFLRPPEAGGAGPGLQKGLTSIQILILALGIVAIPLLARITRATTLSWSQREFVLASKAQGASNVRLMIREVLPNVAPALLSLALLSVGIAIIAEGGLSVLGVGVAPPSPSWGNMIAENRSVKNDPINALFAPMFCLFLTVVALNYLGDAVRDRFEVKDSAL